MLLLLCALSRVQLSKHEFVQRTERTILAGGFVSMGIQMGVAKQVLLDVLEGEVGRSRRYDAVDHRRLD